VAEDLLAELGIPRGTYVLKNGSGLNDTNRFTARQIATLLQRCGSASRWPRSSSPRWASRPGTARCGCAWKERTPRGACGQRRARWSGSRALRVRPEPGRRAIRLLGAGERLAGKSAPVISSIDRLGGMLAALGAPEPGIREAALAAVAPRRTRSRGAEGADRDLLGPGLRGRQEEPPVPALRAADRARSAAAHRPGGRGLPQRPGAGRRGLAGGHARVAGRLPAPAQRRPGAVAADPRHLVAAGLAVDGNAEALARLLAVAPLARTAERDEQLAALLSDGLLEVGDASPEELFSALRAAPGSQAQAAVELISTGIEQSGTDPAKYPLALTLRRTSPEGSPSRFEGWLASWNAGPPDLSNPWPSPRQPPPGPLRPPQHLVGSAADPTPPAPAVVPAPLPQPAGLLKARGPRARIPPLWRRRHRTPSPPPLARDRRPPAPAAGEARNPRPVVGPVC